MVESQHLPYSASEATALCAPPHPPTLQRWREECKEVGGGEREDCGEGELQLEGEWGGGGASHR